MLSAGSGTLRFRTRIAALADGAHPDALAHQLAGFGDRRDPASLSHSTSWRFADSRIVLTYVALPDPQPDAATLEVPLDATARGADPLAPTPQEIRPVDVAAHACRHLAFLHRTDPVVAAAAAREPVLWQLVDRFVPGVAGLLTAAPGPGAAARTAAGSGR